MSSKRKRKDDDSPNDDSPNGKSKTNRTTVDDDVTSAPSNDLTLYEEAMEKSLEKRQRMLESLMERCETFKKRINFFHNKNITHLIVMENQTRLVEEIKRIVSNNDLSHIQRVDLIRTIVHGATVADYYCRK